MQSLPGLVGEARVTERAVGTTATGPLTQAYQQAGRLLVHLGHEDLAVMAAERGLTVAQDGDDELQHAALFGTYCWALLGQGRNGEAERVAERIEPKFSTATPEHITVWGGLVLWAMAGAVEDGRGAAALDHISLAKAGAARLRHGDRHDYQVNFGPSQVAMQTAYTYAVIGEPDKALAAARDVRRKDLYMINYGRHLLDVAQAQADVRRRDEAAATLKTAKDLSPVWFRHQPVAHALVETLRERQTRMSPVVRELVQALNPR